MFPQNTHFSELLTLVSTNKKHFPTQILSLARRLDLNSNQSKHSQFFPRSYLDHMDIWNNAGSRGTRHAACVTWMRALVHRRQLSWMLASWAHVSMEGEKKKKQETTKEGKPNRCLCWRLGRSLNLVKPWRNILMENKRRTKQRVGKMGLHATFAKYASTCWSKTRYGNLSRVCGRLNAVTQV